MNKQRQVKPRFRQDPVRLNAEGVATIALLPAVQDDLKRQRGR